jgi:serine/threonine-protein kinase SRPK3
VAIVIVLTFCRQHCYSAVKVYISAQNRNPERPQSENQEVKILQQLAANKTDHPGKSLVRTMKDSFSVKGPHGTHDCLVHEPLLLSLLPLQATFPGHTVTEALLKSALQKILLVLDYLHEEAHIIHTGQKLLSHSQTTSEKL